MGLDYTRHLCVLRIGLCGVSRISTTFNAKYLMSIYNIGGFERTHLRSFGLIFNIVPMVCPVYFCGYHIIRFIKIVGYNPNA